MKYELDSEGYILSVFWGCHSATSKEYTGDVPSGYSNLIEWSESGFINAYYINNGNLTLDRERKAELQAKAMQEEIQYTPLFKKDLEVSNETLEKQYVSAIANGDMIILDNVKRLDPFVRITDIDCYKDNKVDIYVQAKNLLKNDGKTETINGIDFTKRIDGSININGTATDDIEYNLSGSSENSTSIFVLKKNRNYYLNIGGYECEMKYFDGKTLSQVYVGASGLINLTENKRVTQVILKIPSGTTIDNVTIRPQLEYGSSATDYEGYKANILSMDLSEYMPELVYPSETLYPSATLYPVARTVIDYIEVSQGIVTISVNGRRHKYDTGNVRLFDGFNIIQTLQDTYTEITYYTNVLKADDDIAKLESKYNQTVEGFSFEVSKKVGNDEIISRINQSAEAVTIDADKLNINGTVSANGNFKIDTNGNMIANNGTFNGGVVNVTDNGLGAYEGNIRATGNTFTNGLYSEGLVIRKNNSSTNSVSANSIFLHMYEGEPRFTMTGTSREIARITDSGMNFMFENDVGFSIDGSNRQVVLDGITNFYSTAPITVTSLKEVKKNFEKLENALDIVKATDIYKYNLKNEEDTTKKHIGFVIGDDYNYSEEITSNNNDGVDIYSMVSVCMKAIQEQQAEIESLKEEINKLKEGK